MKTADARSLVNNGNGGNDSLLQRDDIFSKQAGEPANRVIAAGWAQVDRGGTIDHGRRVGSATGVATRRAFSLWQQIIDLFDQITIARGQAT